MNDFAYDEAWVHYTDGIVLWQGGKCNLVVDLD
jgi:hypothetical protein